jgi:hypothetical protein
LRLRVKEGVIIVAEDLLQKILNIPRPSPVLEECSVVVVGDIENINVPRCYLHRIALGDKWVTSASATIVPNIEGGLWLDYIRKYGDILGSKLRLLLIEMSRHKIYVVDASKPYSPLVLSHSPVGREDSVVVLIMPGKGSSVFEKSSSYASYEIARRRAGSVILIDRDRFSNLYGFTGERVLKQRGLEARIVEIILQSLERVMGFISINRRIGVRRYVVAALIGASTTVYGDIYNSFRVLEKCVSWGFEDPSSIYRASSILTIFRAPKTLYEDMLASYTKYLGSFQELLSHEGVYVEYGSRLGLYDLVALLGFPEIEAPDHIVQGHRSLEIVNPDLRIDEVVS